MGTTSAGVAEHRSYVQRLFVILAAFTLLLAQVVVFSGPVAADDVTQAVPDAGIVCGGEGPNSLGYHKPAELDGLEGGSGSYTVMDGGDVVGVLEWDGRELSFTAEPGWTLDICLKGGTSAPQEWQGVSSIDEYVHDSGISHLGYRNPVFTPPTYDVELVKVWNVVEDPDGAFDEDQASATLTADPATDLENGDSYTVTETDVDTGTDQCTVTGTTGDGGHTLDADEAVNGIVTHNVINDVTCEPDAVLDTDLQQPTVDEPSETEVGAEVITADDDVEVAAEVQERLPRTGADSSALALVGLLLTILGATAIMLSPNRRFE